MLDAQVNNATEMAQLEVKETREKHDITTQVSAQLTSMNLHGHIQSLQYQMIIQLYISESEQNNYLLKKTELAF